ncbi:MAG: HDOD domain-containing protein [Methylomonas sp.]
MTVINATPSQPQSIDAWAETLRAQELPIFSNTAQSIYRSLDDTSKGAMDLAAIILQDPNLTAKLLKVSNTPYYNPSRQKISTVSRAIIILGAEVIRELTLACSFFESILSPNNKERANREIAQAIHAAVQARELAIAMNDASPEEVFVAALLLNIGHIAFWCMHSKQATLVNDLIEKKKVSAQDAEKQILGFTLQDLGKKLSKSWRLGGLIEESICRPQTADRRIQIVLMGSELSAALSLGWESSAMNDCLQKLEKLSGKPSSELIPKIKKNTTSAVKIAQQFGAHDASKFISREIAASQEDDDEIEKPDKKQIQFQILQDISSHISGTINLNLLFEMVLEGIHRGVEMDRTLFLLLSPDKHTLNEKISLGWQRQPDEDKIHIHDSETNSNLFFHALHQKEALWIQPERYETLYTSQITQTIGKHSCFVFPVYTENKAIGLIYADRAIQNAPLTQSDFSTAKHFSRQADIGLTLYTIKRH